MPLDHFWLSVDYTRDFEAFTVSEDKYKGLKDEIDKLHFQNVHVIPVVESGISMNSDADNTAHSSGVKQKVFITSEDGEPAVGS